MERSDIRWNRHRGSRCRRPIAQRAVRPDRVVFPPPPFDQHLCFRQRVADLTVEKFITEFAVERFHVAVFPRTAGFDEERISVMFVRSITTTCQVGGPTRTRTCDQRIMRAKRHRAISRFFLRWRLICCPGFPPVSRDSMALRRVCVESVQRWRQRVTTSDDFVSVGG